MARTADERKRANAVSAQESRKRKSEQLDDLRTQITDYKRRLWEAETTNTALVRALQATMSERACSAPSATTLATLLQGPLLAALLNPPLTSYPTFPVTNGNVAPLQSNVGAHSQASMAHHYTDPLKHPQYTAPQFNGSVDAMNKHSVVFNSGACIKSGPCGLLNIGQASKITGDCADTKLLQPHSVPQGGNYCVVPAYDSHESNQDDTDAASHAACWTVEKALSGTSEEGITSDSATALTQVQNVTDSATALTQTQVEDVTDSATALTQTQVEDMLPVLSGCQPSPVGPSGERLNDIDVPIDLFDIPDQGLLDLIEGTGLSNVDW